MIRMICVDCGKETEIFRDGSCFQCYKKNHQFTKGQDVFTMLYCVHCQSYKYKNLWYMESFRNILIRYITHYFSISPELKNVSYDISCDHSEDLVKPCCVTIKGHLDSHEISESHHVEVRIKNHVCDVCSKQFGGYHEAIIQIRPEKKKLSDEKLCTIQNEVEDLIISLQLKNMNLFLADMGREHGGLDFYLSDKQAAYTIIKKLQETYGGHITTSSKNVGMKDGKQLYRDTYLLRLLPFEISDVIRHEDDYYFIEKISKNAIHLIHLNSHKKSIQNATDLESALVMGNKDLIKEMIVVSQKSDEIQVMDQQTYHVYVVKKPVDSKIINELVLILFLDEEHIYVYPHQNQK